MATKRNRSETDERLPTTPNTRRLEPLLLDAFHNRTSHPQALLSPHSARGAWNLGKQPLDENHVPLEPEFWSEPLPRSLSPGLLGLRPRHGAGLASRPHGPTQGRSRGLSLPHHSPQRSKVFSPSRPSSLATSHFLETSLEGASVVASVGPLRFENHSDGWTATPLGGGRGTQGPPDSPRWHQPQGLLHNPQTPFVISLYLQLLLNAILASLVLYFGYTFAATISADVENKIEGYTADILQEIAVCGREYLRNKCLPGERAPALEDTCLQWEKCMNRDPMVVGRAKVGAETFAEIINGFVRPILWKSIFFISLLTFGSLYMTNAAFGGYRESHQRRVQSREAMAVTMSDAR